MQSLNLSTCRVLVTDHGRQYYERKKPLLEESAQADGELTNRSLQLSRLVRIAAPSPFGRLRVLPVVPALLALRPKLVPDLGLEDGVQDLLARIQLTPWWTDNLPTDPSQSEVWDFRVALLDVLAEEN